MQQTIDIDINNQINTKYTIFISDNDLTELSKEIDKRTFGHKRLFVVSNKVFKLYNQILSLNHKECIVLPDGECNKNVKNYIKILEKAIELKLTREDFLIALGGGVIGDMTGFAAATYMR